MNFDIAGLYYLGILSPNSVCWKVKTLKMFPAIPETMENLESNTEEKFMEFGVRKQKTNTPEFKPRFCYLLCIILKSL